MNKFRTVDLFCGGGGLSQGLQDAGFDVVASFDNWQPAIDFYNQNMSGHHAYRQDLGNVDESVEKIGKWHPTIIVGGPPCQDFSSAGKRDENGGRACLTISFAEIVTRIRPPVFIMENVARAFTTNTYKQALRIFSDAGYHVTIAVLDASLCGVPQVRKRVVAVGTLREQAASLVEIYKKNQASKPMTLRDYFGDSLGIDYYYRHPRSYARRAVFCIDEPSPTVRGVNRPIPKGYKGHPGDQISVQTDLLRPLTTKERSMVQTFPEDWTLVGSKADLEQIIGNAVPVKLGEFIGRAIVECDKAGTLVCDSDLDGADACNIKCEEIPVQQFLVFEQKKSYSEAEKFKCLADI